ncbi:MAG: nucleotidyltransferase family protein [Nitrospira sp.]|nr:nucleotidyltransferase family protein [Nitrospira sp.]
MLTLPFVHPFLMALLTDTSSEKNQPALVPHDSWETIVEEAITQRIAPLLLCWLSHPANRHKIPLQLLNVLKQQVALHAAWHSLLAKELRNILASCEQQGIACVPIRGPALAKHLYDDCSTRQMDDLDFLVHREDLSAIKGIFQHLAYTPHEHRPGFLETFSYSLEFVHPHHGFLVEPHWTLAYPPFIGAAAMEPVWGRVRRQQWAGVNTWVLSNEDLLLHLCLHLHHKGRQAPLLWFYELDTVIQRHGATFNWNIFMNQVRLMGQTQAVCDVLTIVTEAFHSPVPEVVASQFAGHVRDDSSPSSLMVCNQILTRSSLSGREELVLLCSLGSLHQQFRYLAALLFPSAQYMTRRYGAPTRTSLIGSYIARFFRIGAEGLRCAVAWIGTIVATRPSSSIRR